jgi:hypothetical protein
MKYFDRFCLTPSFAPLRYPPLPGERAKLNTLNFFHADRKYFFKSLSLGRGI